MNNRNLIFLKDFKKITDRFDFSTLKKSSILITGSTGLIGSQIIFFLDYLNKQYNFDIKIYALARSKEKVKAIFQNTLENISFFYGNIQKLPKLPDKIDYIVHGASITSSKYFVDNPVEVIDISVQGTKNILEFARKRDLKSFIYLSSLEVYGTFPLEDGIKLVDENDSGYIDTMSVRSSYSEGKRLCETMCKSYQQEYGIPVKIARLCQTFGCGVDYNDNRVFAQFARSIIEGKDIILKTQGETVRNYCYIADAISGIITILLKGSVGEAYNIANMEATISIVDMARMFCKIFPEANCNVVFHIEKEIESFGYNPVVKIQLSPKKLQNLGWTPIFSLEQSIKKLVEYMKTQN